jgi:hypothetical protein
MYNPKDIGVYYAVYNNKKAASFVLSNFRKHFPKNKVVLISDGGDDFSDISEEYNCIYHHLHNIFQAKPLHHYDTDRMKEWWRRQKLVCDETKADYIMILEDDVFVRNFFDHQPPFSLRGVRFHGSNGFRPRIVREIRAESGLNSFHYGMCGGSMYNASTFLEIYDDVIADIDENHSWRIKSGYDYRLLGAVDANITYHFNKRGYTYEDAPWLVERGKEPIEGYPVVHAWKDYY